MILQIITHNGVIKKGLKVTIVHTVDAAREEDFNNMVHALTIVM